MCGVSFLFLLPYACSLLFGKEGIVRATVAFSEREGLAVVCEGEAGMLLIPLEEYVEGALAASISAESGMETLKAQAVILRTCASRPGRRKAIRRRKPLQPHRWGRNIWMRRSAGGSGERVMKKIRAKWRKLSV